MKKFTRILTVLVSSLFVMTVLAPSALAFSWQVYGGSLITPGVVGYFLQDIAIDSLGKVHVVAEKYNLGTGIRTAISYNTYDGSWGTWVDLRSSFPSNYQGPDSKIRLDNSGNPGIIYGIRDLDANETTFYFHSASELLGWGNSAATPATNSVENIDSFCFGWDFDTNDNPYVAVCDNISSSNGLYAYSWNEVGKAFFTTPETIDIGVKVLSVELANAQSGDYWVTYEEDAGGSSKSVFSKFKTGGSWGSQITVSAFVPNDDYQLGVSMDLDSLNRPHVMFIDDTLGANGDTVIYAYYNGSSFVTETIASNITVVGNNKNINGMKVHNNSAYVSYYKLPTSTTVELHVDTNSSGSWVSDTVSTLSGTIDAGGQASSLDYDSANSKWIAANTTYADFGATLESSLYETYTASGTIPEFGDSIYLLTLLVAITGGYFIVKPQLGHEIVKK